MGNKIQQSQKDDIVISVKRFVESSIHIADPTRHSGSNPQHVSVPHGDIFKLNKEQSSHFYKNFCSSDGYLKLSIVWESSKDYNFSLDS